jgi:uncharacterized Zn-binding protein involved in type VI secretion
MPSAFRLGDLVQIPACAHGCPTCPHPGVGPLILGSNNVNVNNMPAGRLQDRGMHSVCCGGMTNMMNKGSGTVFINNKPAVRMGDATLHCGGTGQTITGSGNVNIGG